MNAMPRTSTLAASLVLALILGACGSDAITRPPVPSPPAVSPVRTIILSGSGSLPSRTMVLEPFSTAGAGR